MINRDAVLRSSNHVPMLELSVSLAEPVKSPIHLDRAAEIVPSQALSTFCNSSPAIVGGSSVYLRTEPVLVQSCKIGQLSVYPARPVSLSTIPSHRWVKCHDFQNAVLPRMDESEQASCTQKACTLVAMLWMMEYHCTLKHVFPAPQAEETASMG